MEKKMNGKSSIEECKDTCGGNMIGLENEYGSVKLKLLVNDMDPYDYLYCDEVMKAIEVLDSSETRRLRKDLNTFEDPGWQYDWMDRQLRLTRDFVEAHAEGQAEIEMINYDGDLRDIRKHLYKQFGSGSGGSIHEKESDFDRGMPEKGKVDMGESAILKK